MALAMKEMQEGTRQETRAREASLDLLNSKDAIRYIDRNGGRGDRIRGHTINNVVIVRSDVRRSRKDLHILRVLLVFIGLRVRVVLIR